MHLKTRNIPSIDMKIGLNNKSVPSALSTKFLELAIGSTLSRKIHIDYLTTKLNMACYVIRTVQLLVSHKTLLLIYHSLFPAVMNYGIIFWGNSYHSIQILWLQTGVIKIIMGFGNGNTCRILFIITKNLATCVTIYIFSTYIYS
jgi:hypothetical protein